MKIISYIICFFLFSLSSMVMGMEDLLHKVPEKLAPEIQELYNKKILDIPNINYLIGRAKTSEIVSVETTTNTVYIIFKNGLRYNIAQKLEGKDSFEPTKVPVNLWYKRPAVIGSVVGIFGLFGIGYYYRHLLTGLIKNPFSGLKKSPFSLDTQSMPRTMAVLSTIKGLFSYK